MKPRKGDQKHVTQLRVRYGETDRMGVVHHSAYLLYLEEARTALLRDKGYSYRALEDSGVILPVYDVQIRFLKPAYYDDVLNIETSLVEITGVRIIFSYQVMDSGGALLATAQTTLIFTDAKRFKPVRPSQKLLEILLS